MDQFDASEFSGLTFDSGFETFLGLPASCRSSSNNAHVSVSTHDVPGTSSVNLPQCPGCAKYKADINRMDQEHRVNFQLLKKKIISTDLLIRRFKVKQDECELQGKEITGLQEKLDKVTRDSSILSEQLKSAIENVKPLQEEKESLERQLKSKSEEVNCLLDKLQAEKSHGRQRSALDERKRNLEHDLVVLKKHKDTVTSKNLLLKYKVKELESEKKALDSRNNINERRLQKMAVALLDAQVAFKTYWKQFMQNGLSKEEKKPNFIPAGYQSIIKKAVQEKAAKEGIVGGSGTLELDDNGSNSDDADSEDNIDGFSNKRGQASDSDRDSDEGLNDFEDVSDTENMADHTKQIVKSQQKVSTRSQIQNVMPLSDLRSPPKGSPRTKRTENRNRKESLENAVQNEKKTETESVKRHTVESKENNERKESVRDKVENDKKVENKSKIEERHKSESFVKNTYLEKKSLKNGHMADIENTCISSCSSTSSLSSMDEDVDLPDDDNLGSFLIQSKVDNEKLDLNKLFSFAVIEEPLSPLSATPRPDRSPSVGSIDKLDDFHHNSGKDRVESAKDSRCDQDNLQELTSENKSFILHTSSHCPKLDTSVIGIEDSVTFSSDAIYNTQRNFSSKISDINSVQSSKNSDNLSISSSCNIGFSENPDNIGICDYEKTENKSAQFYLSSDSEDEKRPKTPFKQPTSNLQNSLGSSPKEDTNVPNKEQSMQLSHPENGFSLFSKENSLNISQIETDVQLSQRQSGLDPSNGESNAEENIKIYSPVKDQKTCDKKAAKFERSIAQRRTRSQSGSLSFGTQKTEANSVHVDIVNNKECTNVEADMVELEKQSQGINDKPHKVSVHSPEKLSQNQVVINRISERSSNAGGQGMASILCNVNNETGPSNSGSLNRETVSTLEGTKSHQSVNVNKEKTKYQGNLDGDKCVSQDTIQDSTFNNPAKMSSASTNIRNQPYSHNGKNHQSVNDLIGDISDLSSSSSDENTEMSQKKSVNSNHEAERNGVQNVKQVEKIESGFRKPKSKGPVSKGMVIITSGNSTGSESDSSPVKSRVLTEVRESKGALSPRIENGVQTRRSIRRDSISVLTDSKKSKNSETKPLASAPVSAKVSAKTDFRRTRRSSRLSESSVDGDADALVAQPPGALKASEASSTVAVKDCVVSMPKTVVRRSRRISRLSESSIDGEAETLTSPPPSARKAQPEASWSMSIKSPVGFSWDRRLRRSRQITKLSESNVDAELDSPKSQPLLAKVKATSENSDIENGEIGSPRSQTSSAKVKTTSENCDTANGEMASPRSQTSLEKVKAASESSETANSKSISEPEAEEGERRRLRNPMVNDKTYSSDLEKIVPRNSGKPWRKVYPVKSPSKTANMLSENKLEKGRPASVDNSFPEIRSGKIGNSNLQEEKRRKSNKSVDTSSGQGVFKANGESIGHDSGKQIVQTEAGVRKTQMEYAAKQLSKMLSKAKVLNKLKSEAGSKQKKSSLELTVVKVRPETRSRIVKASREMNGAAENGHDKINRCDILRRKSLSGGRSRKGDLSSSEDESHSTVTKRRKRLVHNRNNSKKQANNGNKTESNHFSIKKADAKIDEASDADTSDLDTSSLSSDSGPETNRLNVKPIGKDSNRKDGGTQAQQSNLSESEESAENLKQNNLGSHLSEEDSSRDSVDEDGDDQKLQKNNSGKAGASVLECSGNFANVNETEKSELILLRSESETLFINPSRPLKNLRQDNTTKSGLISTPRRRRACVNNLSCESKLTKVRGYQEDLKIRSKEFVSTSSSSDEDNDKNSERMGNRVEEGTNEGKKDKRREEVERFMSEEEGGVEKICDNSNGVDSSGDTNSKGNSVLPFTNASISAVNSLCESFILNDNSFLSDMTESTDVSVSSNSSDTRGRDRQSGEKDIVSMCNNGSAENIGGDNIDSCVIDNSSIKSCSIDSNSIHQSTNCDNIDNNTHGSSSDNLTGCNQRQLVCEGTTIGKSLGREDGNRKKENPTPFRQQAKKSKNSNYATKFISFVKSEESIPGTIDSIPGTIESIPGTIESIPGTIEFIPGTIESIPGTIESKPGTIATPERKVKEWKESDLQSLNVKPQNESVTGAGPLDVTGSNDDKGSHSVTGPNSDKGSHSISGSNNGNYSHGVSDSTQDSGSHNKQGDSVLHQDARDFPHSENTVQELCRNNVESKVPKESCSKNQTGSENLLCVDNELVKLNGQNSERKTKILQATSDSSAGDRHQDLNSKSKIQQAPPAQIEFQNENLSFVNNGHLNIGVKRIARIPHIPQPERQHLPIENNKHSLHSSLKPVRCGTHPSPNTKEAYFTQPVSKKRKLTFSESNSENLQHKSIVSKLPSIRTGSSNTDDLQLNATSSTMPSATVSTTNSLNLQQITILPRNLSTTTISPICENLQGKAVSSKLSSVSTSVSSSDQSLSLQEAFNFFTTPKVLSPLPLSPVMTREGVRSKDTLVRFDSTIPKNALKVTPITGRSAVSSVPRPASFSHQMLEATKMLAKRKASVFMKPQSSVVAKGKKRLAESPNQAVQNPAIKKQKTASLSGFPTASAAFEYDLKQFLTSKCVDVKDTVETLLTRIDGGDTKQGWEILPHVVVKIIKSKEEDVLGQLISGCENTGSGLTVFASKDEKRLVQLIKFYLDLTKKDLDMASLMGVLWNEIFSRQPQTVSVRSSFCDDENSFDGDNRSRRELSAEIERDLTKVARKGDRHQAGRDIDDGVLRCRSRVKKAGKKPNIQSSSNKRDTLKTPYYGARYNKDCKGQVERPTKAIEQQQQQAFRLFTCLCMMKGDLEQARVLLFNIAWCGYLDLATLLMAVIGVWPSVINPTQAVSQTSLYLVMEYILRESTDKELFKKMCKVTRCLCQWDPGSANRQPEKVLNTLLDHLQSSVKNVRAENKGGHNNFEVMKAVELLLVHQGSKWTEDQFLKRTLVSVAMKWEHKGGEDGGPNPQYVISLMQIFRRVIAVQTWSKGGVATLLSQVFARFIARKSALMNFETTYIDCLLELVPLSQEKSLALLKTWQTNNQGKVPPQTFSKLLQIGSLLSRQSSLKGNGKKSTQKR